MNATDPYKLKDSLLGDSEGLFDNENVIVSDGIVKIVVDGFAFGAQNNPGGCLIDGVVRSCKRMLKFHKWRKSLQRQQLGGYYAVVSDDDFKVFMTEDEALTFADSKPDGCFVHLIGDSSSPDFFMDDQLSF